MTVGLCGNALLLGFGLMGFEMLEAGILIRISEEVLRPGPR